MTNKIPLTCLGLILIFSILLPSINSVGVATPYWTGNPLKLAPGESTTIKLNLQNMVGEEDRTFEATITGEGITLLDGPIYFLPLGAEVPVNLKVDVPKDANIGESYNLLISFKEIAGGEGGMLRVTGAVTTKFPIEVVGEKESALYGKEPEVKNEAWIFLVLGLILLVGIFFITKKKKTTTSK